MSREQRGPASGSPPTGHARVRGSFKRRFLVVLLALELMVWVLPSSSELAEAFAGAAARTGRRTTRARRPVTKARHLDLRWHEAQGGHTLRLHVKQFEAAMRERLRQEPGLKRVSTFRTVSDAAKHIETTLRVKDGQIQRWLRQRRGEPTYEARLTLRHTFPRATGHVLHRGASTVVEGRRVVVHLVRNGIGGYTIKSAYPAP